MSGDDYSYAVQHPNGEDRRAVRSVGVHLMTMCMFLERGADLALGPALHLRMARRPAFFHLEPPALRGRLTMLDVPIDGGPDEACRAAFAWAGDAWTAWRAHHATVRGGGDLAGLDGSS